MPTIGCLNKYEIKVDLYNKRGENEVADGPYWTIVSMIHLGHFFSIVIKIVYNISD